MLYSKVGSERGCASTDHFGMSWVQARLGGVVALNQKLFLLFPLTRDHHRRQVKLKTSTPVVVDLRGDI